MQISLFSSAILRKLKRQRAHAERKAEYKVGGPKHKPVMAGSTSNRAQNEAHVAKLMERINANVHE